MLPSQRHEYADGTYIRKPGPNLNVEFIYSHKMLSEISSIFSLTNFGTPISIPVMKCQRSGEAI